ncbi:unnamed protein product [Paramecium sonneborni]|uniref:Uncharacterized protein n=1 Tax=Paramecium sonneborni TaxID=65129 RepID=A0A8S1RQF2_9CILI|nr:unnamed protein product [Paramecium sonneborni]
MVKSNEQNFNYTQQIIHHSTPEYTPESGVMYYYLQIKKQLIYLKKLEYYHVESNKKIYQDIEHYIGLHLNLKQFKKMEN